MKKCLDASKSKTTRLLYNMKTWKSYNWSHVCTMWFCCIFIQGIKSCTAWYVSTRGGAWCLRAVADSHRQIILITLYHCCRNCAARWETHIKHGPGSLFSRAGTGQTQRHRFVLYRHQTLTCNIRYRVFPTVGITFHILWPKVLKHMFLTREGRHGEGGWVH